MIRRLRSMFGQPGFALLLTLLGLLIFNWPFLELTRAAGSSALFLYFFGAWAGAIVLAFLISRAATDQDPDRGDDGDA